MNIKAERVKANPKTNAAKFGLQSAMFSLPQFTRVLMKGDAQVTARHIKAELWKVVASLKSVERILAADGRFADRQIWPVRRAIGVLNRVTEDAEDTLSSGRNELQAVGRNLLAAEHLVKQQLKVLESVTSSKSQKRLVLSRAKAYRVKGRNDATIRTLGQISTTIQGHIDRLKRSDSRSDPLEKHKGSEFVSPQSITQLFKTATGIQNEVQNLPRDKDTAALNDTAKVLVKSLRDAKFYMDRYTALHLLGVLGGAKGQADEMIRIFKYMKDYPLRSVRSMKADPVAQFVQLISQARRIADVGVRNIERKKRELQTQPLTVAISKSELAKLNTYFNQLQRLANNLPGDTKWVNQYLNRSMPLLETLRLNIDNDPRYHSGEFYAVEWYDLRDNLEQLKKQAGYLRG